MSMQMEIRREPALRVKEIYLKKGAFNLSFCENSLGIL